MATPDPRSERLTAAWKKFNARVSAIRSKTRKLLGSADEEARNTEIEDLRKRIGLPASQQAEPVADVAPRKDPHTHLADAWKKFTSRIAAVRDAQQRLTRS